jgi:hypothetical protein
VELVESRDGFRGEVDGVDGVDGDAGARGKSSPGVVAGKRINTSLGIARINDREVATTISKNNNQHRSSESQFFSL